ncbi:MAG: PilZ domain-containing protein [Polyangiaceae bacterium]|jgi:Tfp pilus assembly protein PilZ|nr:PilZ domain-containing protein [Polyangiaceae bacterium]
MSDISSNARTAREMLAKGLNQLQADPGAPSSHFEAAEPIAQAMGALLRIERGGAAELTTASHEALAAVRSALSLLQDSAAHDTRMMQIMETVAESLGTVFGLTKMAEQQAPSPQQARQPPRQQAHQPPQPVPASCQPPPQRAACQPQPQACQPPQPAPGPYQPPPRAAYQPPQPAHAAVQPPAPQAQPAGRPAPFQPPETSPQSPQRNWAEADPFASVAAKPGAQPGPASVGAPARLPAPDAYRGADQLPAVEAELGMHSATNFYKGLSGNDIVDYGGLFVATYQMSKVGQNMRVHVSLPGGYEFQAIGVVRWTREPRQTSAADTAPPGFGLQFTHISPEARQLVYRYVRNREPLFHDDL